MIDIELLQKAIILSKKGQICEAKEIYDEQLSKNPEDANLLSIVGLFYVNLGDFDNAVTMLKRACEIKPTFGTVSALGMAEYERRNFEDAAQILENSLGYGESVEVYDKLVLSLFEIKYYKKAIEYTEKMYKLYPENTLSIANKVKALTQQGLLLDAEKLCFENLNKRPDSQALWFHLGYLKEIIYCDDRQAKLCYESAAELGDCGAEYNIAVTAQKLGEYEEAEKYYKLMLEKHPEDINTITALGMCYLAQKKSNEGFELFFKRDKSKYKHLSNSFWKTGDKIDNEINIICDQGFGDHIMYSRYFKFLGNKKVNVGTRENLKQLFKDNFVGINFISYEDLNPNIQTFFLTDIIYALDMDFNHIPFAEGYINSQKADIKNDKLKVGFCWEAGSAGTRTMLNRTVNIKFFEDMINLENIQIYSFQVDDTLNGNSKYPQMINLAKDFKNFSDTAKALKAMDVVVTVDTSVAHLAGALGVKTFLLLPYATDWRWFSDTKTTPWYSSVEIFKQKDNISWEYEINEIIERLKQYDN